MVSKQNTTAGEIDDFSYDSSKSIEANPLGESSFFEALEKTMACLGGVENRRLFGTIFLRDDITAAVISSPEGSLVLRVGIR